MAIVAPSELVVTVISSSRIDITWKNNDNYDWIRVYRGKGNTEELAIADLDSYVRRPGSSEYMEDSGLEAAEWYAYKVFGFLSHPYEASDFSNTDAGETLLTLSAPTLVVATPISDTEIDLTFKDNSSEEKWHRVQRKLGAGAYGNVVDLEPNREFYRDTGLAADSLYTYKVHAMQVEGDLGNYALESAQVVTFDVPTAPVLAAILDADTQDKSIRIRWPGVVEGLWKTATLYHVNDWVTNDSISYICILEHTSDAAKEPGIGINWITNWEAITGYKIEQDKDAEGYVEIATIGPGITDFLATGLTPGSTYSFKIQAYNAAGDSAYSNIVSKDALAAYVPTEFEKWIRNPNIEPVYLAEVNPKMTFEGFPFMKDDDLVGCWPFDEGAGMVAYDKSKYGNDGTLYPTPVSMSPCDAVTDWTGTDLSIDTDDKKEGTGSLKDDIAEPVIDTNYVTIYNPTGSWDWSAKKHILFWFKCDRANTAFSVANFYIEDTLGNNRGWNLTFSAGEWTAVKLLLSTGDTESETPPDLALITRVQFYFRAADTTPFYKKIDDLRIDDRPVWVDGVVGKCLDFDGEDDFVSVPDDDSLDFGTDDFSIALWVKFPVSGAEVWKGVITKGYSTSAPAHTWGLAVHPTYLNRIFYQDATDAGGVWNANFTTGGVAEGWHHICLKREGNKYYFYVDGNEVSTDTKVAVDLTNASNLVMGAWANLSNFAGTSLDEIRIYNRALTETEIKALYDSPRNGFRLVSGKTYTYEHAFTDRAIVDFEKVYENGEEYAEKSSINEVEATASTFYFDTSTKILYVHTSTGADPIGFFTEGGFWMYISNKKDIEFNGNFYLPLLSKEDIPDITQEIKPYFEGSFSISSGSIAFANAKIGGEHFFDKRFGAYTWINAKVIVKAGSNSFTYAQFKEIFTAYIDSKSCSDAKITFQLRDMRKEMTQPIVLNKFNTTVYPYIDETFIGKLIPAIFGFRDLAIPIPVDMENQHFKFNDSSIAARSASVERVEKNDVELVENTHFYVDLQRSVLTFERDGRFIITAANKKIDFKEGAGGELTATLTENTYTTAGLCAEIQAKMRAAGSFTYVVGPTDIPATSPKKFTIAAGADEIFSMLWKTGTNGADGTDTNIGTTIGFYDDEDSEGEDNYEADDDMITIQKGDIIKVSCKGFVNSADETIDNGAEIFKYLMNNYKGIQDSELNLDSIYATKSAKPNVLALPIESEPSFDEIVRTIEHSMEAYTFQDELGRLGIKPQQTMAASNVKYVISKQIFDHAQKKDRSTLFWKVNVYYNKDYDDNWEVKTATKNEIKWQYGVTKELPIDTYFTSSSHAADLATSILSLLNKEQIENELPMLLFDVMAGDLIKFSRVRFYGSDGTASEINLRVIRISKSPGSGRTSVTAEAI